MYTDDDKYKNDHNHKSLLKKALSKQKDTIVKTNEENYYQDYYNDYDDEKIIFNKATVNKIDTSYTDDYSDETNYNIDANTIHQKKYVVVIIILTIVLLIAIVILFNTINVKTAPIGGTNNYIRLFNEQVELKVGDTKKLEITLSQTNDENYRIDWFSNNDNVVTVDNNGNIKAVGAGEALILVAYHVDNKTYDAQCYVYVLE